MSCISTVNGTVRIFSTPTILEGVDVDLDDVGSTVTADRKMGHVRVRAEEVGIVLLVLAVWMFAIALFFNRWEANTPCHQTDTKLIMLFLNSKRAYKNTHTNTQTKINGEITRMARKSVARPHFLGWSYCFHLYICEWDTGDARKKKEQKKQVRVSHGSIRRHTQVFLLKIL
uniref:Fibronectin type III domain-containing protein n=1 Tax=Scylla olivacea TaxID=85551 RepID=A0A0P4WG62_SCYOL